MSTTQHILQRIGVLATAVLVGVVAVVPIQPEVAAASSIDRSADLVSAAASGDIAKSGGRLVSSTGDGGADRDWTPEEIREAIANTGEDAPSDLEAAAATDATRVAPPYNKNLKYKMIGRLFYKAPGGQRRYCTATAVGNNGIWTAAHCLHSGNGSQSGFSTDAVFIPSFDGTARTVQGQQPFGQWRLKFPNGIFVFGAWFNNRAPNYDTAGGIVLSQNGKTLEQALGSTGRIKGVAKVETEITYVTDCVILCPKYSPKGYRGPADSGGPTLFECPLGSSKKSPISDKLASFDCTDMAVGSPTGNAADGGPWLFVKILFVELTGISVVGNNSKITSSSVTSPFYTAEFKSLANTVTR